MKQIWVILNAIAVGVIYASPRELTSEELITKPRPGDEYVNIQIQKTNSTVNLKDQSFITSHHIPELTKTDFQTAHKIPSDAVRASRSLKITSNSDFNQPPFFNTETKVSYSVVEGTTNQPPLERVVTRTSIKMTKSKKVQQKTVSKTAHDDIDIKANEGFIDEKSHADDEEQEILKKKFLKNEKVGESSEVFLLPTRFNVPYEDDVKEIKYDKKQIFLPYPVLFTTQEPPITTFNYKNAYEKMKKNKSSITLIPEKEGKTQEKYKYENYNQEYIKTAETKSVDEKEYKKEQESKETQKKDEILQKENSGFFLLPVNKQKHVEDNVDFVDFDDKILVPAGSSPSQSSRINIKKGPNGQEYEYEYVYYYYDDDEDDKTNNGSALKEEKIVSTTEKVYNGHDGPSKEDQKQNFFARTSTSGSKYLPTESTKPIAKNKKKIQAEIESNEALTQSTPDKTSKGRSFTSANKQPETSNNEVLPNSGRSGFRPRGRSTTTTTEEIPSIAEERLPSNTRFPPRFRSNNGPATPQPQEITPKARSREGSNQGRFRIPNSSLLDSSSFRTHSSDASVEEDVNRDLESQRRGSTRGQNLEATYKKGSKQAPPPLPETSEIPVATRRPAIRRPVEERRPKIVTVEQETNGSELPQRPSKSTEENDKPQNEKSEEFEKQALEQEQEVPVRQTVIFNEPSEEQQRSKVPPETQQILKVPLEELQPGIPVEEPQDLTKLTVPKEDKSFIDNQQVQGTLEENQEVQRRPETTRESDAEEGIFDVQKSQIASDPNIKQSPDTEIRPIESTTENQSEIGLTSAMMEKVALDLYAILQQTQNENIRTNFVDGNATDVKLVLERPTEFPTFGNVSPVEPSSTTTTTTTTTTTPPPLSTTTTTTTLAQAQTPGKGRYRGRVSAGAKGRAKIITTTTEAVEVVTTPKTRGRFHSNQGIRGSSPSFGRSKATKPLPKEANQEVSPVEQTSKPTADKSFGERPRNRFRASAKVSSSSVAPPTTSGSPAPVPGRKGNSVDRFNTRRRGNARTNLPQTQQQKSEGVPEEEKHELQQENSVPNEETNPSSTLRPTRQRIGGAIRPLRPGPRAPLILPQRGQTLATTGATQLPGAHEEIAKEVLEQDVTVQNQSEEPQEPSTTQAGDALSRLKSRQRLRIGPNNSNPKLQTPVPPPGSRRKLVSPLLPKRKPNEEKLVEKAEEIEEKVPQEAPIEEQIPVQTEAPSTPAEPEPKGLNGLLAGRRRNLNRRPGTIYTKAQTQAHPAEA